MAQIFLSYQKDDRALAQRMNHALTNAGFSVWWDDHMDPREDWDREIEREIEKAGYVLALWTSNSVTSRWVRMEAMAARDSVPSKLLQARFDDCKLPIGFTLSHYIELDRAQPDSGENWAKLLRWLGARPEAAEGHSVRAPASAASSMDWRIQVAIIVSLLIVAHTLITLILVVTAYLLLRP